MVIKKIWLPLLSLLLTEVSFAQTNPNQGIKDEKHTVFAFTNAYIHVSSTKTYSQGTLVIQDEKIIDCGEKVTIPKEAKIVDCTGKHLYASFIETWSNYGLDAPKTDKTGSYYWNDAIRSDFFAHYFYSHQTDEAEQLRKFGIGTVLTHRMDGILRGSAALVTLADLPAGKNLLVEQAAIIGSLDKGSATNEYPSSLTGTLALIRQFLYDAQWQADMKGGAEKNISLEAFNTLKNLPIIFKTDDRSDIIRLEKIAKEFQLQFNYMGNGDEYDRIPQLKNISSSLIVPMRFPKAYLLNDPYDADMVSLEELYAWETAPANLHILDSNQVSFSISSSGLDVSFDFFRNLKKAIQYGLKKEKALYALTEAPALLLHVQSQLGTLEKGKLANFLITTGELGADDFMLMENWVQGNRYLVERSAEALDVRGNYFIQSGYNFVQNKTLRIKGTRGNPVGELVLADTMIIPMDLYIEKSFVTATGFSKQLQGYIRLSVQVQANKSWVGTIENTQGEKFSLTATYTSAMEVEQGNKKPHTPISYSPVRYPNKAYGWTWEDLKSAENKTYLIKNVTVWTNEKEGILPGYDVITEKGKIKKIGTQLSCTSCETIDGTGKHLTSGIIDEHTHIALTRGGNESGQSSSAEVRMADVLNADDINIYRQLSGGVTTAQVLHGSANAIGGQSALIKLRWGRSEEELLFEGAPGFIKFALGENVKQSNWGDHNTTRYPQTRMGVEQFYFEMFNRAKEYQLKKKTSRTPVRKDLELEILCEILDGKRYITCHSYIQSEINMLMHVADSLGFKVNTFTHILEGYKVADKMKEHGAHASTFADWWAYKFEVNEAIPYNAAILNRVGVNTCVNSDDAEMARRLNHEAAKAMKYGGLTEEEAWKLCTLNPAKMLHINDRVGSIKEGKDADLVLWSSNPLSIYSHVNFTMIDGMIYYNEERNKQLIAYNAQEKNRLVQKMIQAVQDGEDAVPLAKKQFLLYECETLGSQDFITLQIAE